MSAENIINNPSEVFTEPCEACGVSEFQLGVRHAEERIIKLLEENLLETYTHRDYISIRTTQSFADDVIELIKGEQK